MGFAENNGKQIERPEQKFRVCFLASFFLHLFIPLVLCFLSFFPFFVFTYLSGSFCGTQLIVCHFNRSLLFFCFSALFIFSVVLSSWLVFDFLRACRLPFRAREQCVIQSAILHSPCWHSDGQEAHARLNLEAIVIDPHPQEKRVASPSNKAALHSSKTQPGVKKGGRAVDVSAFARQQVG